MRTLLALLLLLPFGAHASECSLYEKSHPTFLLNGSHLSTTKCSTCAYCHINGVFTGTPKSCVTCHNGDPSRMTVGRSAKHIPTMLVECNSCHSTTNFTTTTGTQATRHAAVAALRCDACHLKTYATYVGTEGYKPNDHPTTTTVGGVKVSIAGWDCNSTGCHNIRTFSK
jgi:hypothetical protein